MLVKPTSDGGNSLIKHKFKWLNAVTKWKSELSLVEHDPRLCNETLTYLFKLGSIIMRLKCLANRINRSSCWRLLNFKNEWTAKIFSITWAVTALYTFICYLYPVIVDRQYLLSNTYNVWRVFKRTIHPFYTNLYTFVLKLLLKVKKINLKHCIDSNSNN